MNAQIGLGWTDDRVETLKRMWKNGDSAGVIAAELGAGITRNGVIGKMHRLKLNAVPRSRANGNAGSDASARVTARKKALQDKAAAKKALRDKIKAEKADLPSVKIVPFRPGRPVDDVIVDDGPLIPLVALDNSNCHWPVGDPKEAGFGFCGARAVEGKPYCAKHQARAYNRAA